MERMRFRLQLSDIGDPKVHIMQLQDNARHLLESVRQCERSWYSKMHELKELDDETDSEQHKR